MSFELSQEGIKIIEAELTRYETRLSACLPCLYQIQKEKGYISKEAVSWLSQKTDIPETHIQEVLTFYTLFNKKPVGKQHIQVCCNVSCAMQGGYKLFKKLCSDLSLKENEMSKDGEWTVSRVECLGACDEAPVIQVNDRYIGKVDPDRILNFLKKSKGAEHGS